MLTRPVLVVSFVPVVKKKKTEDSYAFIVLIYTS